MESMEFRKKRLSGFINDREAPKKRLLSRPFKSREEDYTSADYIEFDMFSARDVIAPTLRDARTGTVVVQPDQWSEKRFRPSYIGLEEPIMLYDLTRRLPGESEEIENNTDWELRALPVADRILRKMHNMIGLQVDVQNAQILQTGKLDLKDDKGNSSFVLDFGAKATHFPTAVSAANICDSIAALCDTVAADGERPLAYLIMSSTAFQTLAADATFQKNVVRDGLGLGSLSPQGRGLGETYYGWAMFGMHRLEIYVYNASYTMPNGTTVPFLDPKKIIVLPREEDLDFRTVYGGVPSRGMSAPFSDAFPQTITYTDNGESFIRVHNRVYWYEKGDGFVVEAKSRPLSIPVSLERWGCLTLA